MTRSQEFIKTYSTKLEAASEYFNFDSALQSRTEFPKSKFKFLLILPCPAAAKAVSSTAAVINDYFQHYHPDWFIDVAWMPSEKDIKLFDINQIPYAIGAVTHLDPSHFDVVGFSISILHEMLTTPVVISSFSRCDNPIPLTWTERKDLPLGKHPLIVAGGVASPHSDLLFGELGDGRQAYVDALMLGDIDPLGRVCELFLQMKGGNSTTQDLIDTCFEIPSFYQPQAYEVIFKDNQIVSNKKINPKAQDQVVPFHAKEFDEKRLYTARTITPGSGENAGTAQYLMSTGCAGKANCNFKVAEGTRLMTSKGLLKIEDALSLQPQKVQGVTNESYKLIEEQTSSEVISVTTLSGRKLECDNLHRWLVFNGISLTEKVTAELKEGDVVLRKLGYDFTPDPHTNEDVEKAKLLGFLQGDGCISSKENRVKIYMTAEELEIYGKLFREYCPSKASTRVHYESKTSKLYVIEAPIPKWLAPFAETGVDIEVPEYLFKSSKEVISAYLTGLFQADGWNSLSGDIGLTSISEELIRGVSDLMTLLGINGSVIYNKHYENHPTKSASWMFTVFMGYNTLLHKYFHKELKFASVQEAKSCWEISQYCVEIPEELKFELREGFTREQSIKLGIEPIFRLKNKVSSLVLRNYFDRVGHMTPVLDLVGSGEFVFDKIKSIENTGIVKRMFDVVETESTWCVYNQILTHNCAEGWYGGSWRENSQENILWAGREGRKYSAAKAIKSMSFNTNFHSKFKQNLLELRKSYNQVKFNNMRLNEIGHDYDQWLMMSYLGQTHFAAPIEGISERIRNGILNKGLDNKAIDLVFDNLIGQSVSDIKVGVVLTGYETDDDWQDLYNTFNKVHAKAAVYNKKFPMRVKITGLVHYPGCLTKESLTPIKDKGLVRQDKFEAGLSLPGVNLSEIINVAEPQKVETLKVSLVDGTVITGTYNHPLLTSLEGEITDSSYTKLEDLKQGQLVIQRIGTRCFGSYKSFTGNEVLPTLHLDEELAEVLGWIVGDINSSSCPNSITTYYPGGNSTLVERHRKIWQSHLGEVSVSEPLQGFSQKMTISSKSLIPLILKIVGDLKLEGREIPESILTSPNTVQRAFLSSLWKVSGNLPTKKRPNTCILTSLSRALIRDVKDMLANIGFASKITLSSESISQKLYLKLDESKSFLNFLDLSYTEEVTPKSRFRRVAVCKVEPAGEKVIYGLTVGDSSYVTSGIVSHNTPLWFSERVIARKAFNKERFLTNEQYQRNVDNDIKVKFNGFIGSTFMEQALIDLGRSLTPWVQRNFVSKNHVVFALNSAIKDERAWDEIKSLIVSDKFWNERDPDNTITPFHRIRLELQGALIASARSLISNVHSKEHRASVRCLYTYDGCKPVCGAMDMKDHLHTEFGDCEIVDGKRVGQEIRKITGCDACKTPEERVKFHLKRKIYNSEVSVNDLKSQYLGADFNKYRLVLDRRAGGFKELNPSNTAYMAVAALLRNSDTLLDTYWGVVDYTFSRQTDPTMPFNASGKMIVDVTFRDEVYNELLSTIEKANASLKTCQLKGVYRIDIKDTIKADDLIIYRFETGLSYSQLLMDCKIYKGEIEVMKMDLYEKLEDKTLKAPVIIPSEGKTVGYFSLPTKYNPMIYLSCLVKHKCVGKHEVRALFDVHSIDAFRESSLTCQCGKYSLVSLSSNKNFSCKSCILKQLASKEMKNGKS